VQHPTFGTTLGSFGAGLVSGPVLCHWAEEIERLGFDVLFYRDHVLWHSPVFDPFTALGAFAAWTTRIRIGAFCCFRFAIPLLWQKP
jgi:alkanesulfonate monooxygenase SsuD/methylene tetrahydromethanopterin reductase-like flavin-dependent oxidoreductase (luciferase family)